MAPICNHGNAYRRDVAKKGKGAAFILGCFKRALSYGVILPLLGGMHG
jgi:hypothetical protein